jgi:hypothetical protein
MAINRYPPSIQLFRRTKTMDLLLTLMLLSLLKKSHAEISRPELSVLLKPVGAKSIFDLVHPSVS